jgi:hypothetical protein
VSHKSPERSIAIKESRRRLSFGSLQGRLKRERDGSRGTQTETLRREPLSRNTRGLQLEERIRVGYSWRSKELADFGSGRRVWVQINIGKESGLFEERVDLTVKIASNWSICSYVAGRHKRVTSKIRGHFLRFIKRDLEAWRLHWGPVILSTLSEERLQLKVPQKVRSARLSTFPINFPVGNAARDHELWPVRVVP